MAKYCIKCGKALPDGVEICSECNGYLSGGTDAALFTRMTAETEVWKESVDHSKARERAELLRKNKQKILMGSGAVLLVALTVFILLFTQPTARVTRALSGGDYEKALGIYTEKLAHKEERSKRIDDAILEAAELTNTAFAAHEIGSEEAEAVFINLHAFGTFADGLLSEAMSRYEANKLSQSSMAEADRLFTNGEYLAAYDHYKKVVEADTQYLHAQEQAQACLHQYAQSVLQQAGEHIIQDDYIAAIRILQEGNDRLLDYDTFSEDIDAKLLDCFALHEGYILTEAKNLAALEDYDAAVEMIRSCVEDFGYETESLFAAMDSYALLADEKLLADARKRFEDFYAEEAFAEAFAELDGIAAQVKDQEAYETAISELEQRFAQDMNLAAEESFGGVRENLEGAIAVLDTAIELRPLEELNEYREELRALLPVSLAEMDYSAKEGVIFRNSSAFESLDGNSYDEGWIWGENKASVTFRLDGKYDLLEGVFTNRRKDSFKAYGCFEIWCDDALVYSSLPLYHGVKESMPLTLEVTGCQTLKIVFINNYQVSTAEDGYCYHGLCSPTLTKNIEE